MPKADSVLSTPPTNTSKLTNAPSGAVQLSSPPVIPVAPEFAGQGVNVEPEPCRNSAIHSSGAVVSRRSVMNMLVSTAAISAAPSIAIAGQQDDEGLLELEGRFSNCTSRDMRMMTKSKGCTRSGIRR